VNVMSNSEPFTVGTSSFDARLEDVLGLLNLLWGEIVVVISVEVERRNDVSELLHVVHAGLCDACRVRRAHVGGVFANDVADSHLVSDHLIVALLARDLVEVLVRPGVTGDLVAARIHALDDFPPLFVDCAVAEVVACDEEGSAAAPCFELSHHLLSINVWAVIVSDGDCLGLQTLPDTPTSIFDTSELGTRIVLGGSTVRSLVRIAAGTEVDLTVWRGAVVLSGSAVALRDFSIE
jgi:hypothetical protein